MTPHPFNTTSSRWAALQSRNHLASNAFIYSVITTKIYCRPTCPSRLARKANIVFHDNAADAAADGFRPCKRCRPEMNDMEKDPQIVAVQRACRVIEQEVEEKWSVKELATKVGLTESHFCRVFKKVKGVTVGEYRSQVRSSPRGSLGKEVATSPAIVVQPDVSIAELGYYSFPSDLGSSELTQEWLDFSGISHSNEEPTRLFQTPNILNFPVPELDTQFPSRSSTLGPADDGFEFVDFDSHPFQEPLKA